VTDVHEKVDAHPADWTLSEASEALHGGRVTAAELTEACLERIAARDHSFGAWIRVYRDRALEAARAADARLAAGTAGPLTGVPIGLKDVIGAAGLPLTADSAVLEGNVAPADATAWARLREAGMVLLGHLHCGEFANGVWGANPWGPDSFSPGGSSSGSGVALAARMVPATLGSDGRGSVRMPAAFNGVTGVKPTFGLVSTAGCIPITFTYDIIGPMARSAADCSLLLSVMAGPDEADRTTLAQPARQQYPTRPRTGDRPLAGTRIGIPRFDAAMSDGVAFVNDRFQQELAGLGAELVGFDWPENPLEEPGAGGVGEWTHILGAEAHAIHGQFTDRADLYREEFRVLFAMMSAVGSAADYVSAQTKRAGYVRTWTSIFDELQLAAVAHPAAQDELFGIDATSIVTRPPRLMFGCWSDANFPVVSVPAGLSPTDGSPVGMQLAGLPFTEDALLQVAIDYQAATDHHRLVPAGLDEAPVYRGPRRLETGIDQPPFVPMPSPLEPTVLRV
jgi:aspartyl-tRNA(Asn)/glutamyl-tRNA(Gln) amidotransferase subunit A